MPVTRRKVSILEAAQEHISKTIVFLNICAIPSRQHEPHPEFGRLVHWRIDAILTGEEEALVFDTEKDLDTKKIQILVDYNLYAESIHQVASCRFQVRNGITGDTLVKFIQDNRLQYCEYNADGSGCYTWSRSVVEKLVANGYITNRAAVGVMDRARTDLIAQKKYWVPEEHGANLIIIES